MKIGVWGTSMGSSMLSKSLLPSSAVCACAQLSGELSSQEIKHLDQV